MQLALHIKSQGEVASFSLDLDVVPHQITATSHVTSILQMCITYAESRPSQVGDRLERPFIGAAVCVELRAELRVWG